MNKKVAEIFRKVAALLEIKGDNPYRIRAYQRAAQNIEALTVDVEELTAKGKLERIPGIGKDLAQKIKEILETGTLQKYEELKREIPPELLNFLEIPGFGPKKAKIVYETLGIKSIKELEKACLEHRLARLPGFGPKTEQNILKGIYFVIFKKIFDKLREESQDEKIFEDHINELNKYPEKYKRMTDEEIYCTLVNIIFYAGMNAKIITEKIPTILEYLGDFRKTAEYGPNKIEKIKKNKNMIKHEKKIEACIHNAKIFKKIIDNYGSFAEYLDSFRVNFDDYEGIKNKIKPAFIKNFKGVGRVTVYHFLMELGFKVMKPDRTILRLLYRLGFLESQETTEKNLDKTIKICSEIAKANNLWIRVVDKVLVAFCQEDGNKKLGINEGICTNKPKCNKCPLKEDCWYYSNEMEKISTKFFG